MIEDAIFVLREKGNSVGYVRCREIAQWWTEQREGRGWRKLEPKHFSNEEAIKIVDKIVVNKEKP